MAASRSTRVTRSSVGINGLDENFCGRTLRNRSIAQSDDSSSAPLPRARSPKKRQDSQQHGTPQQASPKGGHHGKVADPKHLQTEREVSSSPRKRGLSFSERECSSKVDNCEIRLARDVSPVQKRARCCSRSGEAPEPKEESPAKTEGSACDSRDAAENEEGPKATGFISVQESRDDIEADLGACSKEGNDQPVGLRGDHKVTNGLDEQDSVVEASCGKPPMSNPECCSMAPEEPCASSAGLLNGGQAVASLILEPDVPCRNSHSEKAEPDGLSTVGKQDLTPLPVTAASSGSPAAEEEVLDVVGEVSGLSQEPAVESTNGGLCAGQENPCISGEADSQAAGYADCPAGAPSFTEPQEHRYALRTSPRRGKSSPPKLSPSSRDNGLKEEEMGLEPKALGEACPKPEEESPSRGLASVCPGEVETKASREAVLMEGRTSRATKENTGVLAFAEDEEDEEDPDVYYFESDHLALKHNKDYQRLLQTIGVLEAQRTQAIMDLEALAQHQRKALDDPIGFVERLQKQLVAGVPRPQRVVQLPDIAWEKYTSGLADLEREFCDRKRNTRRMKLVFDKVGLPARPKSPVDSKKEGESSALYSALPSSDAPTHPHPASTSRVQIIRGRVCDQNKPDTFNQLWTVEEQKKLEQLLLKFPPEEVESKRWQKIADELGNRTAKQVASRVQKYFIKLTKAGIPVPGRTPNMCIYSKKSSSKRQHHLNKHLYRPSTFLTSYEPPVYMDDEDDRSSFYSTMQDSAGIDSDEESIPMECRHLPEYKELLDLKRLKKQKLLEIHAESTVTQHTGYKCDACGVEPIQGVRWHCQDCPPDSSIDFCSNCSECVHVTEIHKPDHRLEPVCQAESFLDRDYCLPQTVGYNYLDPNYFPANR